MEDYNFITKPQNFLDKAYNKLVVNQILNSSDRNVERWEVYEIITLELVNYGKSEYFNEMKYRITDGENPNAVILDIISRDSDLKKGLTYLSEVVDSYLDEDLYGRFFL
jgi:ABC-type glycerol-3-phosphate transport system substrate-binding protein